MKFVRLVIGVWIVSIVLCFVVPFFGHELLTEVFVLVVFLVVFPSVFAIIPFCLSGGSRAWKIRASVVTTLSCYLAIGLGVFLLFQTDFDSHKHVSPVKVDMRTVATGLEAYYVDHKAYPPDLSLLTTPVVYLTSLPLDAFAPKKAIPFFYRASSADWILWSAGPDGAYDLNPENIEQVFTARARTKPEAEPTTTTSWVSPYSRFPGLLPYTYDPTNGSDSRGDVWRIRD